MVVSENKIYWGYDGFKGHLLCFMEERECLLPFIDSSDLSEGAKGKGTTN